jgi:hypothetical protein
MSVATAFVLACAPSPGLSSVLPEDWAAVTAFPEEQA